MAYLEELLPAFRDGVKIRKRYWEDSYYIKLKEGEVFANFYSEYRFVVFKK